MTVLNRYNGWRERGLWQVILAALVESSERPETAMIDSSSVKAYRSAAGAKGRNLPRFRRCGASLEAGGGERDQAIGRSRGERTTKLARNCLTNLTLGV